MLKIFKKFLKQKNIKEQITYDCITSDTTVIHKEARINNLLGDTDSIKFGENTHIRGEFYTFPCGGSIEIGDYCYIGENTRLWSAKNIKIANRVLISHDVNIFDHYTHPLDPQERHEHYKQIITVGFPKMSKNLGEEAVFIEDDAWIGAKSIILPGVTVGKGAIVGAGSVVTKNVEPYTIVAGNPAQFIKNVPLNGDRG